VSEEAKLEPPEPQPSTEASEAAEPAPPPVAEAEPKPLLGPELVSLARKVVPALWLLGAVAAGTLSGAPLFFLVLAAGVLALIVVLLWSSVQSLTGGSTLGFEEALGMGAPSRAEEGKRAVLRALKDLEYERGVGKISPEDYAELSAKYRAEAKRLMQTLDDALGPARAEVEKAIAARLARAGVPSADDDSSPAEPTRDESVSPAKEAP
jgi:hypothetical protein